jgi:lipoprotein NlpI
MASWTFCLLCAALLIGQGLATDEPINMGKNTSNIAHYTSQDLKQATTGKAEIIPPKNPNLTGPTPHSSPQFIGSQVPDCKMNITVDDFKDILNKRAEIFSDNCQSTGCTLVHDEAFQIGAKFPGAHTIEQVCSIYHYLKYGEGNMKGWSYVDQPLCLEYFNYANQSIRIGDKSSPKCVGAGTCSDFAILMSAFVSSIGGTTRIIRADNNTTGAHAYAEVYLGSLNSSDNHVIDIINWLKKTYNTEDIFAHIDTDTKDVWLNLDWGLDEKGNAHPGGPFYPGNSQIGFFIGDIHEKAPLMLYSTITEIKSQSEVNISQSAAIPIDITVNETESNSARVWYNKGNVLTDLGKYDEAIQAYSNAIKLNPNDTHVWNNIGNVFYYQGRLDDALHAYDKVIDLDNKSAFAWAMRGYILIHPVPVNKTQSEEALISLERAIELEPNTAWYWNEKGNALSYLNRLDDALAAKNKSLELDPNLYFTWYDKAIVLKDMHRYNEALNAVNESLKLNQQDADVWKLQKEILNDLKL